MTAYQDQQIALTKIVDAAAQAGMIIYDRPDTMDYGIIDAPIRETCKKINECGWAFTAESCSGHPDATTKYVWGFNRPYLRLTTRTEHMGHLLELFTLASCAIHDPEGLPLTFGLEIYRYPDKGLFSQVGVYVVHAPTVWWRDAAMNMFYHFAHLLTYDPPKVP